MSEWISVKDRLPSRTMKVITWNGISINMDIYSETTGLFFTGADNDRLSVTHWMPLPEPPEGEE